MCLTHTISFHLHSLSAISTGSDNQEDTYHSFSKPLLSIYWERNFVMGTWGGVGSKPVFPSWRTQRPMGCDVNVLTYQLCVPRRLPGPP